MVQQATKVSATQFSCMNYQFSISKSFSPTRSLFSPKIWCPAVINRLLSEEIQDAAVFLWRHLTPSLIHLDDKWPTKKHLPIGRIHRIWENKQKMFRKETSHINLLIQNNPQCLQIFLHFVLKSINLNQKSYLTSATKLTAEFEHPDATHQILCTILPV